MNQHARTPTLSQGEREEDRSGRVAARAPGMHPDEWQARVQLAAAYRIFDLLGWADSAQLHGLVAYHDFEGITIHADEAPRLLASLGGKPLMILRNHGLLAAGPTLPLTFVHLWTLQRACDIQVTQAALGRAIPVAEAVARRTTHDSFQFDQRFGAGQDVFDAMTRLVEQRYGDQYKT